MAERLTYTSGQLIRGFFILLIGVGTEAIYEILEFLLDIGLEPVIKNQVNLLDTDLDMVSDLIGSFTAAYHESCYKVRRERIG